MQPQANLDTSSSNSVAVWKAHLNKLSKAEREMFLEHRAGDLSQYVSDVKQICRQQGQQSRAVKVARLMKPLFETTNMYAPIAQTMVQADPTSSALILGGITCVMSVSARFLDYQEKIVRMLSEMGEKLEILFEYGSDIYQNNVQVQGALMEVFGDVLQFCSEAWSMFRHKNGEPRSSVKTFITSLAKPFEAAFGDIIYKFNKDLRAFEDKALVSDRRGTKNFQSLSIQFMKHQKVETMENHMDVISMGQMMADAANQDRLEEAHDRRRRQLEDAQKKKEEECKARGSLFTAPPDPNGLF